MHHLITSETFIAAVIVGIIVCNMVAALLNHIWGNGDGY